MAVSRNARRNASKVRKALKETDAHNTALAKARSETVRKNLSNPVRPERSQLGLVSRIYAGNAQPVSASKPKTFSHGPVKAAELVRK